MKRPPVGTSTWTEADDAKFRALVLAGLSTREIATELNRSVGAVRSRSEKLEIPLKRLTIRRRLKT
jgi:hypothetical protein